MLWLADLGTDGLRKELEAQQREEMKGLAFDPDPTSSLAGHVRAGESLSRKHSANARLMVDAQRHKYLLRAHIYGSYESGVVREGVAQHVSVLKNLQRQVTNAVAVAYSRPPARVLRGVDKEQARAFSDAYREARTDELAEQWARQAFFLGVVHVLPRYEEDRLRWVTVLPDSADVLFDKDTGEAEPSILTYATTSHGATLVAVDAERWWWLDSSWQLVHEEEHGLGMRPWVAWRWESPPAFDYWNQGQAQDLYESTLELGRLNAHMRWVRKSYSKKTETIHAGENTHVAEGQNMGANQPIFSRGGQALEFDVHDTIVRPDDFINEMSELVESTLEGYGLPSNTVDFRTQSTQDASNAFSPARINKHEAMMKVRDKSVKMFDRAETELAVRAVAVLKRHGRLGIDPAEIREKLRMRFAPLSFADHPKARVETAKAQFSVGATNPYELYMMENPGTAFEEAKEAVDMNVELYAEFNSKLTDYGMTLDPDKGLQTAAQLSGMLGGIRSGEVRSPANDNGEGE